MKKVELIRVSILHPLCHRWPPNLMEQKSILLGDKCYLLWDWYPSSRLWNQVTFVTKTTNEPFNFATSYVFEGSRGCHGSWDWLIHNNSVWELIDLPPSK
jgi:hypothetical protein